MRHSYRRKVSSYYPTVLSDLLGPVGDLEVPTEILADCSSCSMICHDATAQPNFAARSFLPSTKCCTYHPSLPNFLVGGILSREPADRPGRRRLEALIEARSGLLPAGLFPSRDYARRYRENVGLFGRTTELLCPFYEGDKGACGIWQFREATCSTHFCKHVGGERGVRFWEGLRSYLYAMERTLVREVLRREGLRDPAVDTFPRLSTKQTGHFDVLVEQAGGPDEAARWGRWAGREKQFYRKAFDRVASMDSADLRHLMGDEGEAQRRRVQDLHRSLVRLPERLTPQVGARFECSLKPVTVPIECIGLEIDLPEMVLYHLAREQPTSRVLRVLEERHGLHVDPDILLLLFQYGVLVESGADDPQSERGARDPEAEARDHSRAPDREQQADSEALE